MKLKERYRCWKSWTQYSANSKKYKLLVLFGVVVSPTFMSHVNAWGIKWLAPVPKNSHPCFTCEYQQLKGYQDPCYKCYLNPRAPEKVKNSYISRYHSKKGGPIDESEL